MKKIILLMLATVAFFSCKEDDFPVPTALYFETTSATIIADGESLSIPFETTASQLTTTLLTEADWCTVKIEGKNLVVTAQKNNSIAARETRVKVAASDRDITIPIKQEGQPTVKLKVIGAAASSFQSGEGIEKSFDGDYTSIYHSSWGVKDETYTLIYTLQSGTTALDLISYYPRSNAGNGTFGKIEIYAITTSSAEYVKIMDYDCKQVGTPSHIELPTSVKNPVAVKFVVISGKGGFASCAEMEFYKKAEN